MIEVNITPTTLFLGQEHQLTLRVSNTAPEPCSNLIFRLKLPVQLLLLQGVERLECLQLAPGEHISRVLRIRPKAAGIWRIFSDNFSFRDAGGQPRRVKGWQCQVTVQKPPPAAEKPQPALAIRVDTAELLLGEWECLNGKILNCGRVALKEMHLNITGPLTVALVSFEQSAALLPSAEVDFSVSLRAEESGRAVPIRLMLAYQDEFGRPGHYQHCVLLPVHSRKTAAPASRPHHTGAAAADPRRRRDLDAHIERDLALLKAYEDELRYADDPGRRAKYQRDIERCRSSLAQYQEERERLNNEQSTLLKIPQIDRSLKGINNCFEIVGDQLGQLQEGQARIQQALEQVRTEILEQFSPDETPAIAAILEKLTRDQEKAVNALLNALRADRLSHALLKDALKAIRETLSELTAGKMTLPALDAQTAGITEKLSGPALDTKHKLKFGLPIIPLILAYEGELELSSGLNLRNLWRQLLAGIKK